MKRLFAKPVELAFSGGALRVRDAQELEQILSARVSPSAMQIAILGALGAEEQRREASRIEGVEHRILRALTQPPGSMSGSLALLSSLDLSEVTDDNDWRAIMAAVRSLNPAREDLTKAALSRFANYLASARELLQAMSASSAAHASQRKAMAAADEHADSGERQRLAFNLDLLAGTPAGGWSGQGPEDAGGSFGRLPKGETMELKLEAHQSVDLMLARYQFHVVTGSSALLIDENGNDYRLREGKNVLGRSSQCDVCIDACFRAVSRKHAIVEVKADGSLKITDISSLGTFIPSEHLGPQLH